MVRAILDNIEHKQLHLAFICSLRIGEVVGLTWDCVDFSKNKILQRIEKKAFEEIPPTQLIRVFEPKIPNKKTMLILKNPKTEESVREVLITEPLKEELMKRFAFVQKQKQYLNDEYKDNNFVFAHQDGTPVESTVCERWFRRWQNKTSLEVSGLIFHEIRHSSTTYKLHVSGGDIKSVQGDTGHTSAGIILDTYSHTLGSNRSRLLKLIEKDFYSINPASISTSNNQLPPNINDLVTAIKSNPEMQHMFLTALIGSVPGA